MPVVTLGHAVTALAENVCPLHAPTVQLEVTL